MSHTASAMGFFLVHGIKRVEGDHGLLLLEGTYVKAEYNGHIAGCVELVGCIKCEELVKLEGQTDFCWLCEEPRKLVVPIEMRGYQRIYNLERKIYEEAVRGLCPIEAPSPVKFPLPDPQDPLSLKPGFLASNHDCSKITKVAESRSLDAAIAGAQAAATQFSKKEFPILSNPRRRYACFD
ncbi:hypothetical protein GH714_021214 [Hevea brasiliensis]|uniref:Uncharacterized protein n=1 Tax=Hevea brasiliensis TaxID=3981 RepID=A0A6A6MP10_HEVBR|nr:hypothetical protein GH714_021214 [Hevea brasiliensis]